METKRVEVAALKESSPSAHSFTAIVLLRGEALEAARAAYPAELGGLQGLAHALAASPIWGTAPHAAFVLRTDPTPFVAVVGHLDAATQARLNSLRVHLPIALQSFRYVDYAQAERDCARLADRLVERLGRDYLGRCHFAALPRGGFIVLGMLSYALGLDPKQLRPAAPGAPLVLVDDCVLTGTRFRETLREQPQEEITLATLYAHPDLRAAAEQHERVRACVSAHDLRDHAPDHLGPDYAAWRARWEARADRYWVGLPDHVCFAWNEPDVALWNDETQAMEHGWRLLPPSVMRPAADVAVLPVQMHGSGSGRLQLAPDVAFADLGTDVVVCDVVTGNGVGLTAVAADAGRALMEHGDVARAAEAVATARGLDPNAVRVRTEQVAQNLQAQNLLRDTEASAEQG